MQDFWADIGQRSESLRGALPRHKRSFGTVPKELSAILPQTGSILINFIIEFVLAHAAVQKG